VTSEPLTTSFLGDRSGAVAGVELRIVEAAGTVETFRQGRVRRRRAGQALTHLLDRRGRGREDLIVKRIRPLRPTNGPETIVAI